MKNILIALLILISINNTLAQGKRIALIIGNANYKYGNSLKNPVNDANLMERTLKALNFKVIKKINATRAQMNEAIVEFSTQIKGYEAGLFYYAGHGIQVEGINYIIPVDAKIDEPIAVKFEALDVNNIVSQFEYYTDKANIVILDACRENPFLSWVRGNMNSFNPVKAPRGTFIAFSTGSGTVAYDGFNQENGLYTSILASELIKPQRIEDVFINTRNKVYEQSKGKQQPQEWSQLSGSFFFTKKLVNFASSEHTKEVKTGKKKNVSKSEELKMERQFGKATSGSFQDLSDRIKYKWVKIGDQIWMAENSKKFVSEEKSFCYHYNKKYLNTLGMLYTWEGAQKACPAGWHLPSVDEWRILLNYLGNDKHVAGKLKSLAMRDSVNYYWKMIDGKHPSNSSGFNAIPAGLLDEPEKFTLRKRVACFWTSETYGSRSAKYVVFSDSFNKVLIDVWPKTKGFSVRCIKN